MRHLRAALLSAALLACLAGPATAGEPGAERDFEKGFYLENGERDPAAALAVYEAIIAGGQAGRELTARAWVRKGICLLKLGKDKEAREALEKVSRDFADQGRAVQEALEALATLDKQPVQPAGDVRKAAELLKTRLTVSFSATPMTEAAAILAGKSGLQVVLDPDRGDWAAVLVSGSFEEAPLSKILTGLADSKCLDWGLAGGKAFFGAPGKAWELEETRRLKEILDKPVSLDFQDAALEDVMTFIRATYGMNIVVDPSAAGDADMTVQLSVAGIPLKSAFDLLTKLRGLDWRILEGVVFIAAPETLKERTSLSWFGAGPVQPPMDPDSADWAVRRNLSRSMLSVDFQDTPLEAVLGFLRSMGKANIVLSPNAQEKAAEAIVSLALNDMPFERVLRLMLGPIGLEYSVESGALVIRLR